MVEIKEASGERVFVVGDIHGCSAELAILLKHLSENENLTNDDIVIFLGDYIDRGPDTRGVIDLLVNFQAEYPKTRFLRGNHEDMLMDFFGFGGHLGHAFLYNGGLETIQSYGISVFSPPNEMMRSLPENHFKFFCGLESIIVIDNFILVHAGLNPYLALDQQTGEDIFWIREPFLESPHRFEKTVIFGHTPHKEIFDHRPYKLGIDTGLVFGNKLSCFELKSQSIIEVRRGADSVEATSLQAALSF